MRAITSHDKLLLSSGSQLCADVTVNVNIVTKDQTFGAIQSPVFLPARVCV